MIRINLFNIVSNETSLMNFLFHNQLINTEIICGRCGTIKSITSLNNLRCNSRINGRKCGTEISIYSNTFFEKMQISIQTCIYLLYEWCVGTSVQMTAIEYDCSSNTVSNWFSRFREICVNYYNLTENAPIGGNNIIVEIDETCIVRNKNYNGRILRYQRWMLGGIIKGDHNQCFLEHVERRDEITLSNVIRRRVLPGSIIMTDMWRGYRNLIGLLPEFQFTHLTVNHSINFVDPITNANTQSIESFWSVIKRKLRKRGTNHGSFDNVEKKITKDLFKKKYKNELFEKMIYLISVLNN